MLSSLAAVDPGPVSELLSSRDTARNPIAYVDAALALIRHLLP